MAILNPPSGEANFEGSVGFVITILVGHEEQIGWRAEPESVEPDRNGGGKGNAFEEDLPRVELPISIGVFENQDAAVAIGGETGPARFIIPIFRDPETAAIIPAERHRLGDHRLHRGELRLKTFRHGHLGKGLFASEKSSGFAFCFGDAPHHGVRTLARILFPCIQECDIVELAGIDDKLVLHRLSLALGDLPIARNRPTRSHTHLPIDTPMLRVARVLRMIKNRDVRLVFAAIQFHAHIHPDRALCFCTRIALAHAVHHAALHAGFPRHAQEKATVRLLRHGQVHEPFALPFEIQQIAAIAIAHRPYLCLVHHRFALGIE